MGIFRGFYGVTPNKFRKFFISNYMTNTKNLNVSTVSNGNLENLNQLQELFWTIRPCKSQCKKIKHEDRNQNHNRNKKLQTSKAPLES